MSSIIKYQHRKKYHNGIFRQIIVGQQVNQ